MRPKLRDGKQLETELYPIGQVPRDIVTDIGARLIFLVFTGRRDITGDDWGDVFAEAVGGEHLASPVGIADVTRERMAWSMKTVKASSPHTAKQVRLISGRCSPDFSFGIEDPHADIQKTGEAVLAIWNARVDIALSHFGRTRVNVLIRDKSMRRFAIFEEYLEHYSIADYEWRENEKHNLEGIHRATGVKQFVWQPHGSQFTICTPVPANTVKFSIRKPETIDYKQTLQTIGFDPSWVTIL